MKFGEVLLMGAFENWNYSLRFEAFWESWASYMYPDDKPHNPWYLDLGQLHNHWASQHIWRTTRWHQLWRRRLHWGSKRGHCYGRRLLCGRWRYILILLLLILCDIFLLVEGCQEDYPDEFCSKYPPEGIPNKWVPKDQRGGVKTGNHKKHLKPSFGD